MLSEFPVNRQMAGKKGQAFLTVFFLLLITSIFALALAQMWSSEAKIYGQARFGLTAFYAAQAGVEEAKIELAYDEAGSIYPRGPIAFGGGEYSVTVAVAACPPGPAITCRQINSVGRVRDVGGQLVAERQITVRVVLDNAGGVPPNQPGEEALRAWSWREI